MNEREVLDKIKAESTRIIDLRFVDMPGQWQHFSVPSTELTPESFQSGFGFDGSSIRGFQTIDQSDMLVIPDPSTAFTDPFSPSTLVMICDVKDPETDTPYEKDPRQMAKKAEKHLLSTGIADISFWGPELEFFIFDGIRYGQNEHSSFHMIDSKEGIWNTHRKEGNPHPNLGYKVRYKQGYFPTPPTDSLQNIRNEMALTMISCGVHAECHHHEVATAGQCEINMRYNSLVKTADNVMIHKYVTKNVAVRHNKTVTYMPKPLFNDNGTGMHVHQSLWKNGKNLFYDKEGYAMTSKTCLHYIGGLLKHAPALCALIAPTTNSYRRLVPGFEAPVNLVYSKRNRSAAVRIPMYMTTEGSKRIEFRCPDPTSNPYLAFPAMLMAGLDGIKNKTDPGEPVDKDIYELGREEKKKLRTTPLSLTEALDRLEEDHEFLLQGNVFTREFIETWIEHKRRKDVDPVRLRPHPWEFHLYYDA
ncbi:type I glutamate--ammonia ligase [Candidatus Woesearchaeota archaeon]|nr:type I glutamate--ammonia ligase [Candidatus Woesearchaeota archaeon]